MTTTHTPNATRDDALRGLRESDLFVKIRRLPRREQLKLRELIDRMLVENAAATPASKDANLHRQRADDGEALQAQLQEEIAAARKWMRDMGRAARILPGDAPKKKGRA